MQVTFFVLTDLDLGGTHVKAFQESEEPQREVIAFAFHETYFLVGDPNAAIKIELLPQFLGKAFWIDCVVTVDESVLSHGAWELLQVSIAHAEGVQVVV